jgi:hypothetical protein
MELMTKIYLSSTGLIQVDESVRDVVRRLNGAGRALIEFEQVKPRRKTVYINPCHVVHVSAEFSD